MTRKLLTVSIFLLVLGVMIVAPAAAQDEFVFGVVMVGPQGDGGWSQAHFEGGQYVVDNVPGTKMLTFDKLNPADSPETTLNDVVTEMVDGGAKLILTTSDDFAADTAKVAEAFPEVQFIHVSGDAVYAGTAPANLGNLMPQIEWMKALAGCAAALTTQTGSIGYVGPLINAETRRYAAAAYLGAKYCYENYRGMKASDLKFEVVWIGFWFKIAGVTLDPTEETQGLIDRGADVVLSGIDGTEVLDATYTASQEGKQVWAVAYDLRSACDRHPEVCIGVPYYNWGPSYANIVKQVQEGTYTQTFDFAPPDWTDINNPDTTAAGFVQGPALSDESKTSLDDFLAKTTAYATDEANADTMFLWEGPLNLQDGTALLAEGEKLPDIAKPDEKPSIWYLSQLLEGMVGASTAS